MPANPASARSWASTALPAVGGWSNIARTPVRSAAIAVVALNSSTTTEIAPATLRPEVSRRSLGEIPCPLPVSTSPGRDASIASSTAVRSAALPPSTAMNTVQPRVRPENTENSDA